ALSATGLTNAGLDTVVNANIGSPLPIGVGVTHPGFAQYGAGAQPLTDAQAALGPAILFVAAATQTQDITGVNLAGQHYMAGVFNSTGPILISGAAALVLDGNGNADTASIVRAPNGDPNDLTDAPNST